MGPSSWKLTCLVLGNQIRCVSGTRAQGGPGPAPGSAVSGPRCGGLLSAWRLEPLCRPGRELGKMANGNKAACTPGLQPQNHCPVWADAGDHGPPWPPGLRKSQIRQCSAAVRPSELRPSAG
ncbi:unnamed protein product [Rangifer tarandus platyrhynchus]|uniref:Uncharacterized protein n=1 Tax=Rangifer tarandus platyrhynchus TaxID=3082113 RepID=A0ABN8ZYD6_RANTA|nr:unnamed protein product [Rangifer tarandus platyrhynchus]